MKIYILYVEEADKQIHIFEESPTPENAEKALEQCRTIKSRGLDTGEYLQKCYDIIDSYRLKISDEGNYEDSMQLKEVFLNII